MKSTLKTVSSIGLVLILVAALLLGCAPKEATPTAPTAPETPETPVETIEWRVDHPWSPTRGDAIMLKEFADKVYERSGGRLKLTLYPSGALGLKHTESLRYLRDGIVEAVSMLTYRNETIEPWTAVRGAMARSSFQAGFDAGDATWPLAKRIFAEKWNIHSVVRAYALFGTNGFWSKTPIESFEDLKGQKMRVAGDMARVIVESLGASGQMMPLGETYEGMKTGVVDGAVSGFVSGHANSWYEVAPNLLVEFVAAPGPLDFNVNMDVWNALPEDLQRIVTATAQEYAQATKDYQLNPDFEKREREEMVAKGLKWKWMSEEEKVLFLSIQAKWEEDKVMKSGDPLAIRMLNIAKAFWEGERAPGIWE